LCNEKLEKKIIDAKDFYELEEKARTETIKMGATACVADGLVSGEIFKKIAIKDIISLSYNIGKIILEEKEPWDALIKYGAMELFAGKITSVERKTEDGFNKGVVHLEGIEDYKDKNYSINIQNENLIVYEGEKVICMVPDLVTLLDNQSAYPITTDNLKYGQRVRAIAFSCDQKWRTKKGIELVGPRAFGYDFEYVEVENLIGGEDG
jgi:DUF917 family protein